MSLARIVNVNIPAEGTDGGETAALIIIFASGILGLLFALFQAHIITKIDMKIDSTRFDTPIASTTVLPGGKTTDLGIEGSAKNGAAVVVENTKINKDSTQDKLEQISSAIALGANSFLKAEYTICLIFLALFSILVVCLVGSANICNKRAQAFNSSGLFSDEEEEGSCWAIGGLTMASFVIGGLTSLSCGYIGMKIAVYTNVRTTIGATRGWTAAFNAAFRGGSVMGFMLSSLAMLILTVLILLYRIYFFNKFDDAGLLPNSTEPATRLKYLFLFEAIAGYGLGGSTIALFGRVGGGIYTKAADVGADLVGKVEKNIPEDDPRNPATIADNVGDNVGDVAGMGADLFGSFAESTCAALVLSARSLQLQANFGTILFPLVISAAGIVMCIITSIFATNIDPVKKESDVERVLKIQLILSTVLITPVVAALSYAFLPTDFCFEPDEIALAAVGKECKGDDAEHHWWGAFIAIALGLWSGLLTGLTTEYYTSHTQSPVREVAASTKTGAATVIIYGLALGYKSVIPPVFFLAFTIFWSFYLVGLYGVALAALGMLSSFSIGLTIDGYGPITDNAGGIAEMAEMGKSIRDITDTLDAAGNTTAAIGKGFAIGSAALVSLSLFGGFVSTVGKLSTVNILEPIVFAFLLIGAMLPYWFTAMTMKSVGTAAQAMVEEVRRQFREMPGIMDGSQKPAYEECIMISTRASLREMILPGLLVMLSPILTGYLFGVFALSGLLAGSLVSSVQMALSSSNTGGAWDNAKKYIEKGNYGGKGSDAHKAAVVGDTVGDPLKDTSGPSLNILMKLMAIISLVFANSFASSAIPDGKEWAGYIN